MSDALTTWIQCSDIIKNAVSTRSGIICSGIETSVMYLSIYGYYGLFRTYSMSQVRAHFAHVSWQWLVVLMPTIHIASAESFFLH